MRLSHSPSGEIGASARTGIVNHVNPAAGMVLVDYTTSTVACTSGTEVSKLHVYGTLPIADLAPIDLTHLL